MRSRLTLILFMLSGIMAFGQVPDTNTFSLQDVVNTVNPTTNDLQDCINDAVESAYDPTYYTPPATSLLEFRNYYSDFLVYFQNALISDRFNNITRTDNILITAHDATAKYIEINSPEAHSTMLANPTGTGSETWFITQGGEASTLVDVTTISTAGTNRLYYGTTYLGSPNFAVGQKIELFNPFINYNYIPTDNPLFNPYPTTVGGVSFSYIHTGGMFEKINGTYVLLCPVSFNNDNERKIYYATSPDLETWTFTDTLLLEDSTISFAKHPGNVFTDSNPLKMNDGKYLFLLAVETPSGNYTSAYMVIDENLNITTPPTQITINSASFNFTNHFPLAITYYNGGFRAVIHNRADNIDLNKEAWEFVLTITNTDTNLLAFLNGTSAVTTATKIHDADLESGYLNGKMDGAEYIAYGSDLFLLKASEQENVGNWVTSNNREIGIAKLVSGAWVDDVRSPILVNPVQLYNKYPQYDFAWDHFGAPFAHIIKNGWLYLYINSGTNSPDYWVSGIKIQL